MKQRTANPLEASSFIGASCRNVQVCNYLVRIFNRLFVFRFLQTAASNATQVVIKNVGFGLSGNFSCEVTADSASFSTATANAQMTVVGESDARDNRKLSFHFEKVN